MFLSFGMFCSVAIHPSLLKQHFWHKPTLKYVMHKQSLVLSLLFLTTGSLYCFSFGTQCQPDLNIHKTFGPEIHFGFTTQYFIITDKNMRFIASFGTIKFGYVTDLLFSLSLVLFFQNNVWNRPLRKTWSQRSALLVSNNHVFHPISFC